MSEKIDLFVPGDDGPILIGCVEVPGITSYEEAVKKLLLCWVDWRHMLGAIERLEEKFETELPKNDSDFIPWLVDTHGWVKAEPHHRLELP